MGLFSAVDHFFQFHLFSNGSRISTRIHIHLLNTPVLHPRAKSMFACISYFSSIFLSLSFPFVDLDYDCTLPQFPYCEILAFLLLNSVIFGFSSISFRSVSFCSQFSIIQILSSVFFIYPSFGKKGALCMP